MTRLAWAAMLGVVATGCQPQAASTPAATYAHAAKRDELTALWTQIRDWRREADMHVEPSESAILAARGAPVRAAAAVCPVDPRPPRACEDVCGLADAICENAEAICEIADELGRDAWALGKCDNAKASCREARLRCCGCVEDEATPAAWSQPLTPEV